MEIGKDKVEEQNTQNQNQDTHSASGERKGKSCKGTLYYSSILKSKSRNPRCVGISRTLPQVPKYIVSESEVEASKEGRSLTDFKYACVGYSVFLDNKDVPADDQKLQAELPVCIGIELLVDRRPASLDHDPAPAPAQAHGHTHAHSREDERPFPQPRPLKTPHTAEEFLTKFSRNAGLVASGVARNMTKVGNYIKDSVDDILYPYRRRK